MLTLLQSGADILQEDGSHGPQQEASSDKRRILVFHTLCCFSLNCNCFLHNKKTCSRMTKPTEVFLASFKDVAE